MVGTDLRNSWGGRLPGPESHRTVPFSAPLTAACWIDVCPVYL